MKRHLALMLLLLAMSLPAAAAHGGAHVEHYSETRYLNLDPWRGTLMFLPEPVYTNVSTEMRAQLYRQSDYSSALGLDITFNHSGPVNQTLGEDLRLTEVEGEQGRYNSTLTLAVPGNHTFSITAVDENGTRATTVVHVQVYPDLPIRIAPADDHAEFTTNRSTSIAFLTLDKETRSPVRGPDDLKVRFEQWDDAHQVMHFADEKELRYENGQWVTAYDFPRRGMYHLFFASESMGFEYDDTPLLHLYAFDREEPAQTKDVPAPGMAGFAAALVGAALALAAVVRRRAP